IGILGCMVLLVGGLGMKDTMTGFMNTIDKNVLNYQTRINFAQTVANDWAAEFASRYDGDYVAATSVQVKGEPISLEIYDVAHDCVRFIDKNDKSVTLSDDGAYISLRVADRGYKVGDTLEFSPYGSELTYSVKIVGILRSMLAESITMTTDYAMSINLPFTISSAFVNVSPSDIEASEFVLGTQSKTSVMDSYNSFMQVMDTMVWVLVLAAVVLGVVVLYNLGVMSYTERSRELATLKVVGFKNKHIGRILIGQNIWLTVVGIIIGLPAGVGVLQLLITLLAREYELKMAIGALTYCVSILLTFGVSMLVSIFVARKNKKINMVEALKGAE
ncbi:MAG: ABC transporter permease, partial [[Eubacterium] siraeum]|nr:ABC transporter permease [[Eubacterium] siraeum]